MPASSDASSALSTASFTHVSSAFLGLSNPSRCRFLVKNSETEISRWRAPISTADTAAAVAVAMSPLIPDLRGKAPLICFWRSAGAARARRWRSRARRVPARTHLAERSALPHPGRSRMHGASSRRSVALADGGRVRVAGDVERDEAVGGGHADRMRDVAEDQDRPGLGLAEEAAELLQGDATEARADGPAEDPAVEVV